MNDIYLFIWLQYNVVQLRLKVNNLVIEKKKKDFSHQQYLVIESKIVTVS